MKYICSLVMLLGLLAARARAQDGRFETLVQAEEKFARFSLDHGIRSAFLEFLADSGIIFRPGPVNGKSVWRARPDPPARLSWHPEAAGIAPDGRLGWTLGPWELRDTTGRPQPIACGHYLSVWAPDSRGSWRVLLDAGVDHDCPPGPTPGGSAVPGTEQPLPEMARSGGGPLESENEFEAFAATGGSDSAYRKYAADDIRLLRSGAMPILGIAPLRDRPAAPPGRVEWAVTGGGPGEGGDLGFVYGEYRHSPGEKGGKPAERGYFVRIWKRVPSGRWKIAVDLENRSE